MTRIEVATTAPGAAKAGQTAADSDTAADAGSAKDAFRMLLRHLSGGGQRNGAGKGETGGTRPQDTEHPVSGRPVTARPGAGKVAKPDEDTSTGKTDPKAMPNAGDDAALPVAETPTTTPIVWPEALTRPAADAAPATDDDQPASEPISVDAMLRAVSTALTATPKAEATAQPRATGAVAAGKAHAEATAAKTTHAEATTRDPFAALQAVLQRDEPEIDLAAPQERGAEMPKVSILTRETHFEPVQRLSPVQQVATSLLDEVASTDATAAPRSAAPFEDDPARTSSRGPLRVLHIKLEPEDLGAVVLRMRLVGQSLELHLEASRAETAQMLDKDRDALVRVLRASGYTPDVVTVQTSTASDGAQAQSGRSGGQDTSNGSAAFQQSSRDGRPGDDRNPPGHTAAALPEIAHDDVEAGRAGGGLYL